MFISMENVICELSSDLVCCSFYIYALWKGMNLSFPIDLVQDYSLLTTWLTAMDIY